MMGARTSNMDTSNLTLSDLISLHYAVAAQIGHTSKVGQLHLRAANANAILRDFPSVADARRAMVATAKAMAASQP